MAPFQQAPGVCLSSRPRMAHCFAQKNGPQDCYSLAVRLKKRGWEALAAWLGAGCLCMFTYISGRRYPYYALVLAVFAPLGLAALASPAARITKNLKHGHLTAACGVLACLLLLAGPLIAYQASPNTYLMKVRKEDMPQYRFAEIIRQSEDQTLLNYGFLDGGFYFASGVLPSETYFCTLNIDLPEMEQSLQESVAQGKTAFVVSARNSSPCIPRAVFGERI